MKEKETIGEHKNDDKSKEGDYIIKEKKEGIKQKRRNRTKKKESNSKIRKER